MEEFVKKYLENWNRILSDDYIKWLEEFILKHQSFCDDPNTQWFATLTESEQKNVLQISKLFSRVLEYFDNNGIDVKEVVADFFNMAVSVKLSDKVAIELITFIGQGAVTEVFIIPIDDAKVDLKRIIEEL